MVFTWLITGASGPGGNVVVVVGAAVLVVVLDARPAEVPPGPAPVRVRRPECAPDDVHAAAARQSAEANAAASSGGRRTGALWLSTPCRAGAAGSTREVDAPRRGRKDPPSPYDLPMQPATRTRRGSGSRPLSIAVVVTVGIMIAAGCSGSGTRAGPPSTTRRPPASVAPVGTAGCGRSPEPNLHGASGNDTEVVQQLTSGGTARTYRLAVPRDDTGSTPRPLVLDLHGSGSNAVEQSVYSGVPAAGVQRGWIVVTPDAIGKNWTLASPTDQGARDRVFAVDLLDSIETRFCIDTARVYATGISLGSAYSAYLACTLPDRIAAVGLVATEVLLAPCPRTVPAIVFHGTADAVVLYDGGKGGSGIPLPATRVLMSQWAALDKCRADPIVVQQSSEVQRSTWQQCAPGSDLILYTIAGGGHTWPGASIAVTSLGATTHQINATALILDFLAAHSLAHA